ncbi:MAG: DUF3761 domain-containing protein [Pseudonocardiales bacterium]
MTRPDPQAPQSTHDRESTAIPRQRSAQIGNVPFILALLSAVLTFIPATRTAGMVLLLLLGIPALVAWIRSRKLTDGSRGLTTSTLVICALVFVFGAAMSPSSPPSAPTPDATSTAQAQRAPAQLPTAEPPAPQASPAPAPVQLIPPVLQPAPVVVPAPKIAPIPPAQPPVRSPAAGTSCGAGTYVNVDGDCVQRPTSASSPPPGATARCKDGEYSFSQNRRGTCSGHGGVAAWL